MTLYLLRKTIVLCETGGKTEGFVVSLEEGQYQPLSSYGMTYFSKCFFPTL